VSAAQAQSAPGESRRLLTVPEACEQLRVSRWTVNRLIQTRALRTIKIGSRRLVPLDAIQEFVVHLTREID
jgi:excisionase family DNA binding protein